MNITPQQEREIVRSAGKALDKAQRRLRMFPDPIHEDDLRMCEIAYTFAIGVVRPLPAPTHAGSERLQ